MLKKVYTPLTAFAGGVLVGVYYSDDLRASSNLASNRVGEKSATCCHSECYVMQLTRYVACTFGMHLDETSHGAACHAQARHQ